MQLKNAQHAVTLCLVELWWPSLQAASHHLFGFNVGVKYFLLFFICEMEMEITMVVHHFDGRGWGPSIFSFGSLVVDDLFSFISVCLGYNVLHHERFCHQIFNKPLFLEYGEHWLIIILLFFIGEMEMEITLIVHHFDGWDGVGACQSFPLVSVLLLCLRCPASSWLSDSPLHPASWLPAPLGFN